jgi:hypothetical protein
MKDGMPLRNSLVAVDDLIPFKQVTNIIVMLYVNSVVETIMNCYIEKVLEMIRI